MSEGIGTATAGRYRHPLAALRAKAGYTHGEYAHLIAQTHAELGFGQMAARREKVSRWETGRAVPELTAQLAMAHIHAVPQEEVISRKWPDWLHLAIGDARQLELPWTNAAVPEAILDAVVGRKLIQQEYLLATGTAAKSLAEAWTDAMSEALAKSSADPTRQSSGLLRGPGADVGEAGSVLEACTRLRALQTFTTRFTADWLVHASEMELRTLANHFLAAPEALRTSQDLLIIAAEGLAVCGFIARLQGEHINSQRYYLAALRCATAAADAETAAAIVTLHVGQYLDLQLHEEAAELITAVGNLLNGHQVSVNDPALVTLMHAQTARIHAMRGDDLGRRRALVAGRQVLDTGVASGTLPILPIRSHAWLRLMDGVSLLDLGQPDRAIKHFAPVLSTPAEPLPLPPAARAMYMLRAAETQVALGNGGEAADTAAKAATLLGGVKAAAAERVRLALHAYTHLPSVNRFLESMEP
ncbi:transcriptional regulator [Yinghuangia soli]|uniref:Transcriptional regulator n=1 Tax=Yinghuangia soli TaxID=2908204 RepID=A0AA41U2N7_9ACTN|nr:transcriptional regulator [Yinghuangia soli]MCF2528842.1 transcriptional regulator [Yinghuangia soli]